MNHSPQQLKLDVPGSGEVDAVVFDPGSPSSCFVFAHGAGAGMRHGFMVALSAALARRGIATLRFQFPYMQEGRKLPDRPPLAQAAIRAACAAAAARWPGVPLHAGGKSFGGRMTSLAQSIEPIPGVHGLVFVGFPLHAANEPASSRADHLAKIEVPMLFLQGTRDALAEPALIREVVDGLGLRATLHTVEGGDHSFAVPASAGRRPEEIIEELADAIAGWMRPPRPH